MARKQEHKRSARTGRFVDGPDTRVRAGESHEDRVTGAIERQTSRMPSVSFLGVATGAIGVSLFLKMTGRDGWANFIAQWVPTVLIMGVYNKMVKQHGSDAQSRDEGGPWYREAESEYHAEV